MVWLSNGGTNFQSNILTPLPYTPKNTKYPPPCMYLFQCVEYCVGLTRETWLSLLPE